ncbi:hypothetical protein AB6A40_001039 [Gnathostoma spinigerum]|uniref:Uncharacterized protein n=1 Tax=Gnathostoma spinigerum TaxID=75299 RepID=A0ABD6E3B2_9BILA
MYEEVNLHGIFIPSGDKITEEARFVTESWTQMITTRTSVGAGTRECLPIDAATSYEHQKLSAEAIQRSYHSPKLTDFLSVTLDEHHCCRRYQLISFKLQPVPGSYLWLRRTYGCDMLSFSCPME